MIVDNAGAWACECDGGGAGRGSGREDVEGAHEGDSADAEPQRGEDDAEHARVRGLHRHDEVEDTRIDIREDVAEAACDGGEHGEEREVAVEDGEPAVQEMFAGGRLRELQTIGSDDGAQLAVERDAPGAPGVTVVHRD